MKTLSEITVFDSLLIYFFDWQEGVMSNNKKREKRCCNISETN